MVQNQSLNQSHTLVGIFENSVLSKLEYFIIDFASKMTVVSIEVRQIGEGCIVIDNKR